jgi:hypothetical protein
MVMRKHLGILSGIFLFVFGCATQPPTLYGDHRYPALSADLPVAVYMKESDIHGQYEVIGSFGAIDLGKWQLLTMEDALPVLKEKARSMGANAIIIDDYQPVKSGIISTGYSVRARGIRLNGS